MSDPIYEGLQGLTKDLNKDFDTEIAVTGDDYCVSDVPFRVPTSSFLLNKLLGGGIPVGRVMEIFGDPSTGKSTLVEHMMIAFQRYPGISVLIDADTGWYRPRAVLMGHNNNRHLHLQADTLELGFEVIQSTIKRIRMPGKFPPGMPVGIFYDAISASQTEGEKEEDQYKDGMADGPRKVRKELRKLAPVLPRCSASIVFVSHTHTDLKAQPKGKKKIVPKKSSSFGDAIKFWSAKRLKIWRAAGSVDAPYKGAGIFVGISTYKDKLEPPFRTIEVPLMHQTGIHHGYELVNFLIDHSHWVNMNGAYVCVPDYPEPGKELNFFPKQLDIKLQRFPDLIGYLESCAEETWENMYGPQI
jgi:recombination protein RecA